ASLRNDDLLGIKLSLPTINEQKKVASILRTIDTKIELNRRINDNLEQQAQTLFKSWLVDFDPFKNGKFVESEMGMIPEGWKVISLQEYCQE
ncbi:restriction endonuclease subunit S, partial [Alistipes finegoldii]